MDDERKHNRGVVGKAGRRKRRILLSQDAAEALHELLMASGSHTADDLASEIILGAYRLYQKMKSAAGQG